MAFAKSHLTWDLLFLVSIASLGQAASCFAGPVIHKSGGFVRKPESTKSRSLGCECRMKSLYF